MASVNKSLNRASNPVFEEDCNRLSLVKCFLVLPICGTFTVILMVRMLLVVGCVCVHTYVCALVCVFKDYNEGLFHICRCLLHHDGNKHYSSPLSC